MENIIDNIRNQRNTESENILKCFTPEEIIEKTEIDVELEKGGEGSKGGKIIGHTKSGKPIYEKKDIKNLHIGNVTPEYGGGYAVYVTMHNGEKHAIRPSKEELLSIKGAPIQKEGVKKDIDVHDFALEKINSGSYSKVEKRENK